MSRKLLQKHEYSHREPLVIDVITPVVKSPAVDDNFSNVKTDKDETDKDKIDPVEEEEVLDKKEPVKKVGVLDLPPLNLSSESDSESDQESESEFFYFLCFICYRNYKNV